MGFVIKDVGDEDLDVEIRKESIVVYEKNGEASELYKDTIKKLIQFFTEHPKYLE